MDHEEIFDRKRSELLVSLISRILVWGSLFGILYLLRSFFLLIFLVFIFSYIQANAVNRLAPYIRKRSHRATIVGVSFLAFFVILLAVLVPQIRHQTVNFMYNFSHYAQSLDAELVRLTQRYPALEQLLPQPTRDATVPQPHEEWGYRNSTLSRVIGALFNAQGGEIEKRSMIGVLETARDFGSRLLAVSSQFLLSLLFSFLIVLDLPNLERGAKSVRRTKLKFVYDEMADSLVRFGLTMGRAFEAQFFVASINTVLTLLGIWVINIREEMAFLALVVFICGFVPIAGVFISSVPICLLALAQGGISRVVLVIILITGVHAVESYIVNPRVFGSHMKMNPVIVMMLMTVSGKLFGVWGLVLCVPIATYLFRDAIQLKGQKELPPAPLEQLAKPPEKSRSEPPSEPPLAQPDPPPRAARSNPANADA
ncbi:MAG: AI-2E family transporter [Vulcanimicrobiota bacterium]